MKKINAFLMFFIGFLLFNVAINGSIAIEENNIQESESTHLAGEFAGDYYYYLDWYNESFPGWEFHDEYQYWEILWLNNGIEDTWMMVVIDYNLTISDSGEMSYLNFQIYDDPDGSFLDGYEDDWDEFEDITWDDYEGDYWVENGTYGDNDTGSWDDDWEDLEDVGDYDWGGEFDWDDWDEDLWSNDTYDDEYGYMEDSLNGDEGFWFIDIYFEEWNTNYTGYIDYTWYNVEFDENNEIIIGDQIDPALLGPATEPLYDDEWYYNWDWEWAQMMLENQTYDDEGYSWTWFSYDIGQWVSWYDDITKGYSFLTQDISYMGMSLFEDVNENGVVDATYDYSYGYGDVVMLEGENTDPVQDYSLNNSESEFRYFLNIESVDNVIWGEPKITENNAEFWICLQNVEFLAIPYGNDYDVYMMSPVDEDLSIPCQVEYLNISFFYEGDETGSSVAIKHDIAEFTDPVDTGMLDAFQVLSLTIDYYVYSDQYNEVFEWDETVSSENLDETIPVDGEISVEEANDEFMNIDFSMNYTWGKNGNVYDNTVAIIPLYSYQIMYDDMEIGQASTLKNSYETTSFLYSMCFNWEGYSVTLDPTFVSYYIDFEDSLFNIAGSGIILILTISAGIATIIVIKNKQKFNQ